MNSGYSIVTRPSASVSDLFWSISSSGVVILISSLTPASQLWNVKQGVLYNQNKQIYFDVQNNRFVNALPIQTRTPVSACTFAEVQNKSYNWEATITTAFTPVTSSNGLAQFNTLLLTATTSYTLPVYWYTVGGITYPVLGSDVNNPVESMTTKNTIQYQDSGTARQVPLSGFLPFPALGTVVQGLPVKINRGSVAAPSTTSWTWIGVLVLIVLIMLVTSIILVFTKKKEIIPISDDPVFQEALMRSK